VLKRSSGPLFMTFVVRYLIHYARYHVPICVLDSFATSFTFIVGDFKCRLNPSPSPSTLFQWAISGGDTHASDGLLTPMLEREEI
jgi:hypothetical protein